MKIDKNEVRKLVLDKLESDLEVLIRSANEAKDFATDEEAKAENKYDTKGLEASYLAGAQAGRAKELAAKIDRLQKVDLTAVASDKIGAYSLLCIEIDEEKREYYFILPEVGGEEVVYDGLPIMSLSLESPLAQKLMGLVLEDEIQFKSKEIVIVGIS